MLKSKLSHRSQNLIDDNDTDIQDDIILADDGYACCVKQRFPMLAFYERKKSILKRIFTKAKKNPFKLANSMISKDFKYFIFGSLLYMSYVICHISYTY